MPDIDSAVKVIDHAQQGGPVWWLLAMAVVYLVSIYFMFRFFVGQVAERDKTIRLFADAQMKRVVADERITRAKNIASEAELLKLAASTIVHPDLKDRISEVIARAREEIQNSADSPVS